MEVDPMASRNLQRRSLHRSRVCYAGDPSEYYLAQKMREETEYMRYRARVEETQPRLYELMWISCTGPPTLGLFGAGRFRSTPVHLSSGPYMGLTKARAEWYTPPFVGSLLGFGANVYQDKLYRRNVARKGPEAQLYVSCLDAVLFPLAMFMFAWTALQELHWIWPHIM
ncbi:hypothetical protein BS17DRAFT_375435 [Gyrodon lividus]|nr:hypothetical protein BS17DRAFT_375435 [Gyrodon lividus]